MHAKQWTHIHLYNSIMGLTRTDCNISRSCIQTNFPPFFSFFFLFFLHARQFQKSQRIWSIDTIDSASFPAQRYHWRGIRKKLNLGQIWNSVLHFSLAKEIRSWSNSEFNFTFCLSSYWYPVAMGYYHHFYFSFYFYLYHRIVTSFDFAVFVILITSTIIVTTLVIVFRKTMPIINHTKSAFKKI